MQEPSLTNGIETVAKENHTQESLVMPLPDMEASQQISVEEPTDKKPAILAEPEEPDQDIPPKPFSWLDSHASIVIILAGTGDEEQQAFAIQKDFLCSKSSYFRKYFLRSPEGLETIIKFPDVTPETFGFVQNFLFTNAVYTAIEHLPGYEVLINIWKVGHDLGIDGLCNKALEAMQECRQITQHIPATPLLVQVWNETPEGSTIRTLLLGWAAEYMRSSEERTEFAKSLPKEVLSELVVVISSLGALTPTTASSEPPVPPRHSSVVASPVVNNIPPPPPPTASRKNVHYMAAGADDADADAEYGSRLTKKVKRTSTGGSSVGEKKPPGKRGPGRPWPSKQQKRRSSATTSVPSQEFSTEKKLEFCADLLTRMLSGPGFWTRLVGPFKHPVVPSEDGVPDYLDKIKKPMDLGTIKSKMDNKEYTGEIEFATDVRQIFDNCYTYWSNDDAMWTTCVKFQKTFEEKYAEMNKWLGKMSDHEGDEQ